MAPNQSQRYSHRQTKTKKRSEQGYRFLARGSVRRRLAIDEAAGILPTISKPLDLPIDEIIRRTRHPELTDDSCDTLLRPLYCERVDFLVANVAQRKHGAVGRKARPLPGP